MNRLLALGILGVTSCAPRLYTEGGPWEWEAPTDNSWSKGVPPDTLRPEGWSQGQVVPDVRGIDQFGDELSLWQFYGKYVLVDISTMWCAPCQELAEGAEYVYQKYIDEDVVYLTILVENEYKEGPTVEELNIWAQWPAYGETEYTEITSPIISDPLGESGSADAVRNGSYPVVLLVGPDLKVVDPEIPTSEAEVEAAIELALCEREGKSEWCD